MLQNLDTGTREAYHVNNTDPDNLDTTENAKTYPILERHVENRLCLWTLDLPAKLRTGTAAARQIPPGLQTRGGKQNISSFFAMSPLHERTTLRKARQLPKLSD